MEATSAVILVVDRLGAGWLGPYGNTWVDTPQFNRLAAESLLLEWVIADSPELAMAYRGYWTGRHALEPDVGPLADQLWFPAAPGTTATRRPTESLPALASRGGAASVLITDDPQVAELPLAGAFGECKLLKAPVAKRAAEEIEQTGLFRLFEAAAAELRERTEPTLLWIHAAGMSGAWDAPLELRNQFADEDDPAPPNFVEPPSQLLKAGFDPDELLGFVHAYAGQVTLLDLCLGMLLEALDEHPRRKETLLAVTSPRGFPLGEHLRVGPVDEALYGELLHVPLFLRLPGGAYSLARTQQIVQPHELYRMVTESCGWTPRGRESIANGINLDGESPPQTTPDPAPVAAYSIGREQRSIRTPAWFLRESRVDDQVRHELFAKPDDRWEANEVSSRCGEVVELLATRLDKFEEAARKNRLTELPPLAETLCDVWR